MVQIGVVGVEGMYGGGAVFGPQQKVIGSPAADVGLHPAFETSGVAPPVHEYSV